jgi:hypothetical protein
MSNGIAYGESLVQALEKSLRSEFHQPHLRLTRKPTHAGSAFNVSLERGDRIVQMIDGTGQHVLEILIDEGTSSTFYFSVAATFELYTSKYALQHASISVFHDIYAGELTPLFRAEWDPRAASDSTSEHAQPHWHFVQSPKRIEGLVRTLISQPREFQPEPESEIFAGLVDCGKFHFAMTSLLETQGRAPHKQLFDATAFPKWFASLTKYIAGQIAYIVAKAPAPPIREFTPTER